MIKFCCILRTSTGSSTGSYTTTGTRTQTGVSTNWDSDEEQEEEENNAEEEVTPRPQQRQHKHELPTRKSSLSKEKKPVVMPRKSVSFEDEWDDESLMSQSQTQSNWDDTT